MKIVVLSGGSGNDALVKGLKALGGENEVEIKVIVNAYDNGKSTGVCRAVTGTLGVSDIRKNHSRMYKATFGDACDKNLVEFYEGRYDFERGHEREQVCDRLRGWKLDELVPYAENFFRLPKAREHEYKNFSVSNIVYAEMFREIGYEKTNKFFCDKLGLDDFVILNSFDNVYIKALTESGHIIEDEGETVFWNNASDKIVKTIYELDGKSYGINPRAIESLQEADLIIISTGTFWSSLQPTIEYLDFYRHINRSHAKKIWVLNNEEDGDSFGVNSIDFVKHMEGSGLDLSDFSILVNKDARDSMKLVDKKHHFVEKSMGNIKGKHDCKKFALAIMQIYYGFESLEKYDKIIFDFDDTIWARNCRRDEVSHANVKIINQKLAKKAVIISGNTYESISEKLQPIFGKNLEKFDVEIWADANSTLFEHGKIKDFVKEFLIDKQAEKVIEKLAQEFDLKIQNFRSVNYKIKPLGQLERKLLCELVNLRYSNLFRAKITGKTTVDIVSKDNDKSVIFRRCGYDKMKTLFIGDEIESGNDCDISHLCTDCVSVTGVEETNFVLHLLLGE